MSSSTVSTMFTDGITTFWGYITAIFSSALGLGIGIAVLAAILYFLIRAPRKIF